MNFHRRARYCSLVRKSSLAPNLGEMPCRSCGVHSAATQRGHRSEEIHERMPATLNNRTQPA